MPADEEKRAVIASGNPEKRKLYTTFAYVAISFLVIMLAFDVSLYSFGWISDNKVVKARDLTLSVDCSPNLIISDKKSEVTDCTVAGAQSHYCTVFTSETEAQLEPAMHYSKNSGVLTDGEIADHSLVVVKDISGVNPITGMANDKVIFEYIEATEGVHYIDFVTYIGVSGMSLTYKDLKIKINLGNCYTQCAEDETVKNGVTYYTYSGTSFTVAYPVVDSSAEGYYTHIFDDVYLTTSIDVFYEDVFVNTLHPSDGEGAGTVLSASGTLTSDSPVKVLLRVYFDGSMQTLVDKQYRTILRASNQRINRVFLGFGFSVEEAEN